MKTLKIIILLIIGLVVVYKLAYPTYTYRYRMTVEVNTPEGVKSGSSVIEVTTSQWPKWLSGISAGNHSGYYIKGEAVFVDLGSGKNMVTLLATGRDAEGVNAMAYLLPHEMLNREYKSGRPSVKWARELSNMVGNKIEIQPNYIPTTITFINDNDPRSAEILYSTESYDANNGKGKYLFKRRVAENNIQSVFGEGYTLKGVYVELTQDPVSNILREKLRWMNNSIELKEKTAQVYKERRYNGADIFFIRKKLFIRER